MSHALFSIVPLMIGVFGGTISAIVVIRNIGNQRVKDNLAAIDKMIRTLLSTENFKDSDNHTRVCDYRHKVENCHKAFTSCTLHPVIIFTAWVIMVSFCVSLNGDCIKALNYPYNQNLNNFEQSGSQIKEKNSADPHLLREVFDGMTEWLGSVLLGAKSILLVTLVDLFFIIASLLYLRRAKTQYIEVGKIYQTLTGNQPEKVSATLQKTGGTAIRDN